MGEVKIWREDHNYKSNVSYTYGLTLVYERCNSGQKANLYYSDETEITSVYSAGPEDVDIAVAAARKAFKDPSWRDISSTDRGDLLYKLSQLIEQHKETLATIETWDNGILAIGRIRSWK